MKLVILLALITLSITAQAKCRKLIEKSPGTVGCPNNKDLLICENQDVRKGVSISSAEAEWRVDLKSTFCGIARASDQAYCTYEEAYPRNSPYSSGDLLKATLLPLDPKPVPTWDLSGSLDLRLANGKRCSYSLD